jgi:hypothetical protein
MIVRPRSKTGTSSGTGKPTASSGCVAPASAYHRGTPIPVPRRGEDPGDHRAGHPEGATGHLYRDACACGPLGDCRLCRHRHSADNGSEFAYHYRLAHTLGIPTYFADPYSAHHAARTNTSMVASATTSPKAPASRGSPRQNSTNTSPRSTTAKDAGNIFGGLIVLIVVPF